VISSLALTPQVFVILSSLIEERTGLHFEGENRELLAEKVSPRAAEAGFDSLLEYYYYLRYDAAGPDEIERLVEHLVVNETYLFRELDQLRTLVTTLLPPVIAAQGGARIWCAACATGEEVYSLAILLAEQDLLGKIELVASDISRRALDRARRGEFRRRSLRSFSSALQSPWLRVDGDCARIDPRLANRIRWQRINLVRPEEVATLDRFDFILCRNVLIYFGDQTTQRVLEQLASRLEPSGCLLVGASESLLRFGTMFECEEWSGSFFYRRTG
jgi:chemotaxis protein methyltransferase CheR